VTLVRCTLTGGRGAAVFFTGSAGNGGNGIFARNSNVLLEACAVTGGRGGGYDLGEFLPGRAGGHGIETPGSLLVLVGGSVTGGRGEGPDCDPFSGCGQGGPGGDGLHITNGTAVVELRGATLAGGAGGAIADQEPNPGVPLSNPDGSVVLDLPAPPRAFAASSPVRDGEDLVLTFDGEPGDGPALLFFSLEPGWIGLLARQGVFALGFPLLLPVPLPVTLDAQGDAIVSLTMPALGVPGLPLFMQAAFVSPSDGGLLASPSATTVIDTGL
jgi:hypothetical protein